MPLPLFLSIAVRVRSIQSSPTLAADFGLITPSSSLDCSTCYRPFNPKHVPAESRRDLPHLFDTCHEVDWQGSRFRARLTGSAVQAVFRWFIFEPASLPCSVSKSVGARMSAHKGLADLLSQEYYLSKVLVHLIDDGLHECRRVCRKWHEVCSRLPVKLSLGPETHLLRKPDLFPNAGSLKLDGGLESDSVECRLLPYLSRLNRITHLEFSLREWPSVCFRPMPLENMYTLQSLSLKVQNESVFLAFLETMRRLTELTSLKLSRVRALDMSIDVPPITEMKQLRVLRATPCFLVNQRNAFVFGTQTRLTRLEVLRDLTPSYNAHLTLQVTSPSACLHSRRVRTRADDLSTCLDSALLDAQWSVRQGTEAE